MKTPGHNSFDGCVRLKTGRFGEQLIGGPMSSSGLIGDDDELQVDRC